MAKTRRAYLDCDGTLSNKDGQTTIKHPTYDRLIQWGRFPRCTFKNEDEAVAILNAQLNDPFGLRLAPGAMDLINALIESDFSITIVTRNFKEYIRPLLLAEGLPKDILNSRIIIKDRSVLDELPGQKRGVSQKYLAVSTLEREAGTPASIVVTCDDDKDDNTGMEQAAREYKCPNILSYNAEPGSFNFKSIISEIKALISKLSLVGNASIAQPDNSNKDSKQTPFQAAAGLPPEKLLPAQATHVPVSIAAVPATAFAVPTSANTARKQPEPVRQEPQRVITNTGPRSFEQPQFPAAAGLPPEKLLPAQATHVQVSIATVPATAFAVPTSANTARKQPEPVRQEPQRAITNTAPRSFEQPQWYQSQTSQVNKPSVSRSKEKKDSYSIANPLLASGVSAIGLFTSNSVASDGAAISWGLFAKMCAAIPVWSWAILFTISAGWLARNIYKRYIEDASAIPSSDESYWPQSRKTA